MRVGQRHFEAFRAIIVAGGFTKGARLLGVSQPSISRLIQQLQAAVGFALFTRIDGQTVPTAEARILHEEVERSFVGLDKLMQRARDIERQRIGQLRVVSMPALAQGFLPCVLTRFLETRPHVRVSLQVQRSDAVAESVTAHNFDVGFAMLPVETPGVAVERFDDAEGVCLLPPAHPLANSAFITAGDLKDLPFISIGLGSPVQRAIDRAFEEAGMRPNSRIETPLSATACQFVRHGAGIAIVDPFTAREFRRAGLVARPFRPAVRFQFGILYPSFVHRSAIVQQFVAAVREARDRMLADAP